MLDKIYRYYHKFERFIGSMEFAVVIILIFAVFLGIGTFWESWYGMDYAQKAVYKSWWFILAQVLMFLSILVATIVRLPPRRTLYGFYAIHVGLLMIFIGSFVTYYSGVDGVIELVPNQPSNKILLREDVLKIQFVQEGKSSLIDMPSSAYAQKINKKVDGVTILNYYPSADTIVHWFDSPEDVPSQSGTYRLQGPNFYEDVTFSLNPNSDFESIAKMGPLNVHYMPEYLYECFNKETVSGYLVWDIQKNHCAPIEELNIEPQMTSTGNEFIAFPVEGEEEWYRFFPNFSPLPLNDDLTKIDDSRFRVFSKNLFKDKPNLFIFGRKISYYQTKRKKTTWVNDAFTEENDSLELPWMGMKIIELAFEENKYPVLIPEYTKPIQDNGDIIHGNISAIEIKMGKENYWVRTDRPLILKSGEEEVRFQILPKMLLLPYELHLDRFEMQKNPGTNAPASYESYVTVFDGRNPELGQMKAHIYMNNPLKYDGFTFYQASYYPIGEEVYASVLTVNFDPGRWLKYLGSLLLVLGSTWHYFIRSKSGRKFFSREVRKRKSNKKTPTGGENA